MNKIKLISGICSIIVGLGLIIYPFFKGYFMDGILTSVIGLVLITAGLMIIGARKEENKNE